jgi:hypothetical protein
VNGTESLDLLTLPGIQANQTPHKPPLKWAGGKRWLVPYLLPFWRENPHRRLVKPFVGGMAVTLELLPEKVLLNDINPHLISFYRWLQSGLRFDIEMRNDEELYYRQRDRFNELIAGGNRDIATTVSVVLTRAARSMCRSVDISPSITSRTSACIPSFSRVGRSPAHHLRGSCSSPRIWSTQILLTMWNFDNIPRNDLTGLSRRSWLSG